MLPLYTLVIMLITPAGRVDRIEYPPVSRAECVAMLRADVAADPKGYAVLSASCEVAK